MLPAQRLAEPRGQIICLWCSGPFPLVRRLSHKEHLRNWITDQLLRWSLHRQLPLQGAPQSARVMETLITSQLHHSAKPQPIGQAEIFQVWSPDQQHEHQCGLGNAHSQDRHPKAAEAGTHRVVSSTPGDTDSGLSVRTAGLLVNSPDSGVRPSVYRCWVALALLNWMILPEKVTEPLWISIHASKPQKSKAEGLKSTLEDQDEFLHVPQNKFLAHSRYSMPGWGH